MIEIEVSGIVDAQVIHVYKMLDDCHNYTNWWKMPVKSRGIQSKSIEFPPILFTKVVCKKIESEPSRIVFDYVRGPFRGHGIWTMEEIDPGKIRADTILTFEIVSTQDDHYMVLVSGLGDTVFEVRVDVFE
jgi:ribosome-associated toxin RatA of RatAB toxin-antitoxin module